MRARFLSLHLDSVGFFASFLCALHCAFLPFLLVLIPFAPLEILHAPFIELLLVAGSMLVALFSLLSSFRRYRRKRVLLIMLLGFFLILTGLFAAPSQALEMTLCCVGGVLVAVGHYVHWRYTHRHA